MKTVVAKYTCTSVIENGNNKTAYFYAVYGNGKGNEDFAKSTPCGQLVQSIDKDVPAAEFFKQGKNYLLTFEETE